MCGAENDEIPIPCDDTNTDLNLETKLCGDLEADGRKQKGGRNFVFEQCKPPPETTTTTTPFITSSLITQEYTPDCIPEKEILNERDQEFLQAGIPFCPTEEPVTGYEYPVPQNPLTFPTKPTTRVTEPETTTITTTPFFITSAMTTDIVPECIPHNDALNDRDQAFLEAGIPFCPTEEDEEPVSGYEYPVPQNPLTFLTTKSTPIIPTSELTTSPFTTATSTKASISTSPMLLDDIPDCVPEDEALDGRNPELLEVGVPLCPSEAGYEYPVPENPLTYPGKVRGGRGRLLIGLKNVDYESGVSLHRAGRVVSVHIPALQAN